MIIKKVFHKYLQENDFAQFEDFFFSEFEINKPT